MLHKPPESNPGLLAYRPLAKILQKPVLFVSTYEIPCVHDPERYQVGGHVAVVTQPLKVSSHVAAGYLAGARKDFYVVVKPGPQNSGGGMGGGCVCVCGGGGGGGEGGGF